MLLSATPATAITRGLVEARLSSSPASGLHGSLVFAGVVLPFTASPGATGHSSVLVCDLDWTQDLEILCGVARGLRVGNRGSALTWHCRGQGNVKVMGGSGQPPGSPEAVTSQPRSRLTCGMSLSEPHQGGDL